MGGLNKKELRKIALNEINLSYESFKNGFLSSTAVFQQVVLARSLGLLTMKELDKWRDKLHK